MLEVLEHDRCTGCSSCYTVCSHAAITMIFDNEGFEYPVIDSNRCVDCGLCQSVCPVIQYDNRKVQRSANCAVQKGYAARNENYEQRLISSSGSIFPPIAEWIIESGGLVVGSVFDESFNVHHMITDSKEELKKLQGSKYLQCKADNSTFRSIRRELNNGRLVLYSGMACQVEGLKSFLKKEYANLFTIDLICMGIPSPLVWQSYLNCFFGGETIEHVNFKEKSKGWDSFCFHIITNKREYKERGMDNLYLQSMFRSWNIRPSCFNCPFKNTERISDFTLADCWGAYKLVPELNDNKGLSSVIIHSSKGYTLWTKLRGRIKSKEIGIDDIAAGNTNLVSNKPQTGNRQLFYNCLQKNPKRAFKQLCNPNPNLIKRIFYYLKNSCNES